jgi:hypothetical protein
MEGKIGKEVLVVYCCRDEKVSAIEWKRAAEEVKYNTSKLALGKKKCSPSEGATTAIGKKPKSPRHSIKLRGAECRRILRRGV